MDLNARDLYFIGDEVVSLVNLLSNRYGIPVIAGSDTHHYLQLGSVANKFHSTCDTIDELKSLISSQCYSIVIDKNLKVNVAKAREMKKALVSRWLYDGSRQCHSSLFVIRGLRSALAGVYC